MNARRSREGRGKPRPLLAARCWFRLRLGQRHIAAARVLVGQTTRVDELAQGLFAHALVHVVLTELFDHRLGDVHRLQFFLAIGRLDELDHGVG